MTLLVIRIVIGYSNSDSESNIGDLIKEQEPNTKISVASVLKKCPGTSDIGG